MLRRTVSANAKVAKKGERAVHESVTHKGPQ